MDPNLKQLAKNIIFNEKTPDKALKEFEEKKALGQNYKRVKLTQKLIRSLKQMWIR